jgi:hypothetical protein
LNCRETNTPKDRLIELASKQQGKGIFTQYVKKIAAKKLSDGIKPKGRKHIAEHPAEAGRAKK